MTFSDCNQNLVLEQSGANYIVVDREQFCELMVSNRKLVRSDDRARGTRGLLDVESGERFVIDQERLFASCR